MASQANSVGVLENMIARIERLEQQFASAPQQPAPQHVPQQFAPPPPQYAPQQPAPQQFAPPPPQPVQAGITADHITNLITPYVADPNIKAALQAQMAAMGIAGLPETQPHQYGELYQRFQSVIAQAQQAQAGAGQIPAPGQVQQPAPPPII